MSVQTARRPADVAVHPGLAVRGVSHAFGDRQALAEVSFGVTPGVMTGLLGPNGAGKTTLLRVLLGVLTPDRGSVTFAGRPVAAEHRRRWGYMPQERGLYPAMRAGEQVVYFGRLHGLTRREAVVRAHAILGDLGLAERWADRTSTLSGGMQQRLQLATALVHEPEVIVLDEPFAGLDPLAVADLSRALRARSASGCTVLFSSHQLDLVQDLCEDIAMIDHGWAVLAGSVADLRAASGERQLRLHLATTDRSWLPRFPGVTVVGDLADELRLALPADVDPLVVLDAARAVTRVDDFGLELPTLSQLFVRAADLGGRP
ncbi:ABC transporter ATP-binding protein [uncultured Cellulomonas sp.]|uniref:ABC transporter ATP-binding protein n=1 Tax=uncultured Cellulomonas sp. TaxID=189682 RepID=UPI00261FFFEB|nr:ATP-binding cassette domain-containing protein [uncultured Cellulomonas sp.]